MEVLRLNEVIRKTSKPSSSIYREVKNGTFPAPIKLGPRAVGWIESEIDEWIEERAAERERA